ncbi:MAG: hypothetical protein ATN36_02750 [Epulopiscium sp. Nele67-Bin005]|nr:MAG: hypothetical protein ATN36_02750 [Epulopiscium sp. Nele67-Bin005]
MNKKFMSWALAGLVGINALLANSLSATPQLPSEINTIVKISENLNVVEEQASNSNLVKFAKEGIQKEDIQLNFELSDLNFKESQIIELEDEENLNEFTC